MMNILGQNGFLTQNDDRSRLCLARGPIQFSEGIFRTGGMFLFCDVLIVARKLVQNRRYLNEKVFEFRDNFRTAREKESLTLFSEKNPEGTKIYVETRFTVN